MLRDSIAKFFKVDSLISNLTGYVETRIELLKVEAKEELSKSLSLVLVFLMLAFVFALFIVFISVSVGLKISESLGTAAGFAIVAGFYLLLGAILTAKREAIGRSFERKLSILLKKKKE